VAEEKLLASENEPYYLWSFVHKEVSQNVFGDGGIYMDQEFELEQRFLNCFKGCEPVKEL
jgi:hypothetical protein